MRRVIVLTLTVLTTLALAAVPAMAQSGGGDGFTDVEPTTAEAPPETEEPEPVETEEPEPVETEEPAPELTVEDVEEVEDDEQEVVVTDEGNQASGGGDELAYTGFNVTYGMIAAGALLLSGGALLYATRRRSIVS